MVLRREFTWAFMTAASAAMVMGCVGDAGPAGSKGDPGAKGEPGDPATAGAPTLSSVIPVSAFLARTIDVTISGNGTRWTDKTTADFGPKIKVNAIVVASPTALVANITVDAGATLGARDIKVSGDGADLVYKGAFGVRSPLDLTIDGKTAQGSVYYVRARGLDFTTPFDTTFTGDGFFTPLVFTNISVSQAAGVYGEVSNVTDYVADFRFVTDVDTTPGPQDFWIQSGPAKDFVDFPAPAAYAVEARKPTALVAGTPAAFQVDQPADSALFIYAPADVSTRIVDIDLSSTDADAFPAAYFLPKSGKFNELFAAGSAKTIATTTSDPIYLIALDGSPSYAGYTGKITLAETPAASGVEKEPNDSKNLAMNIGALAPPHVMLAASLSDETDVDWYAVTVGAADVGKSIRAQTTGFDPLTDTVIDIFEVQGNSLVSIGPNGEPSSDSGYLDELTSTPAASAGTYFVKVYASTYIDLAHNTYDLIIRLE